MIATILLYTFKVLTALCLLAPVTLKFVAVSNKQLYYQTLHISDALNNITYHSFAEIGFSEVCIQSTLQNRSSFSTTRKCSEWYTKKHYDTSTIFIRFNT